VQIEIASDVFHHDEAIRFPEEIAGAYFKKIDTNTTRVLAENDRNQPVAIAIGVGDGLLVFSTLPLALSNYGMVKCNSDSYVSMLLSILGDRPFKWTEYYQLGRAEHQSPLRYVMSNPALRSAFGVLMLSVVLLFLFNSKRKQRPIPPLVPVRNTSLDFVKTIGSLYHQQGDHRDLALKKVLFFTDYLKQHFYIDAESDISGVIEKLSAKTGIDDYEIKLLFEEIRHVNDSDFISRMDLLKLNSRIDNIYHEIEESYKR
jgi:hypothetical protein